MGPPLYAGLKTLTQLDTPSGRLCLIPHRPHKELDDGSAERLPYPYGVHYQTLIQCNEAACHHSTVSSPGRGGIIHPVYQIGDDNSELIRLTPEAKYPIIQLNRLRSQRPSSA